MTDKDEIKLIRLTLKLVEACIFKPEEELSQQAHKQIHSDYKKLKKLLKVKVKELQEIEDAQSKED